MYGIFEKNNLVPWFTILVTQKKILGHAIPLKKQKIIHHAITVKNLPILKHITLYEVIQLPACGWISNSIFHE